MKRNVEVIDTVNGSVDEENMLQLPAKRGIWNLGHT
jgi:hypothetical protein